MIERIKSLGEMETKQKCVVQRFEIIIPDVYKRQAVYDIGRNDGSHMETGHAGRVELPTPAETGNHLTPYLYGTDKE